MLGSLTLILAAALAAGAPMALQVERQDNVLEVSFQLLEELPAEIEEALPTGVEVRVRYPLRIRKPLRLWWDRKVWKGEVVTVAVFDPVTGRYRGEMILDGIIVTSRELADLGAALGFLKNPGIVRLSLPPAKRPPPLRVKVRAIFDASTKWLVFPSIDGTDWVEVEIVQPEAPPQTEPVAAD